MKHSVAMTAICALFGPALLSAIGCGREAAGGLNSPTATAAIAPAAATAEDEVSTQAQTPDSVARTNMIGHLAPALNVNDWINTHGKALSLAGLRGQVVVLDFFAFW